MNLIHAFIEYLSLEKKYSKHTIVSYQNDLVSFLDFLETEFEIKTLDKVHYSQIRSWIVFLAKKTISNNSINRKMSSLKTFYNFLIKTKTISKSPLQKHKVLKTAKRINVPFTQKEIDEVLQLINDSETDYISLRNKLIIEMFYTTGIRRSELIELKIADVDLKQNLIKVLGKRNKERYIPIIQVLHKTITAYLKERSLLPNKEYLFITNKGKKLYGTFVYRLINNYFSSVSTKVKKSPHVLRHAFATHLLNEGADLNAVKELLGHSSLASTQVYTNSSLKELKNVYNRAHPRSSKK